jgi:hypothetical protein
MASSAARAGAALRGRRARSVDEADPYAAELEWPALRRAILAKGGIGPSRDWDREDYPGDLYREHGLPPDLLAEELTLGRADLPPWGPHAGDDGMMRYLRAAHREWERNPARHHSIADPELAARRRGLREAREGELRTRFGSARLGREQGAHEERMRSFVESARAARRSRYAQPAVGFFTDRKDIVHPITVARRAGSAYAARRGH